MLGKTAFRKPRSARIAPDVNGHSVMQKWSGHVLSGPCVIVIDYNSKNNDAFSIQQNLPNYQKAKPLRLSKKIKPSDSKNFSSSCAQVLNIVIGKCRKTSVLQAKRKMSGSLTKCQAGSFNNL